LWRDLADEDVAGAYLSTDANDATLVEVFERLHAGVRQITSDLFFTQLGVARIDVVLFDVNRREGVFLHQVLAQDDRILVVVALPRHERNEQVLAERELTIFGRGAVGDNLASLNTLTGANNHAVVVVC